MFFPGCFDFDDEHFQLPHCADFSVAKFSDDGHKRRLSNPYCGAQFTCRDVAVIPNQRINFSLSLFSVVTAVAGRPLQGPSPTMDPASK
jgi:hypothetical protein